MADTDAFVTALLADNARLRAELETQAKIAADVDRVQRDTERRYISALYRACKKAGGNLDLSERQFDVETRRLHIDTDYGDRIERVRLVEETEVISVYGGKTYPPDEAEAA